MITTGCDLDGTFLSGFRPPESEYVFVTGRLITDWSITIRQIGAERPLFMRPVWFPGNSPHWKSMIIQTMKLVKFYEDDIGQAQEIKRCCPQCQVVIIQNGQIVNGDFA